MIASTLKRALNKRAEKSLLKKSSTEEAFTYIYDTNKWGDDESRSGKGSNLEKTAGLREAIPRIVEELGITSMLDIPCGDYHWMKEITLPLDEYVGADIVKALIARNEEEFGDQYHRFIHLDLMRDPLGDFDAIFCRECLVHLSFADISLALNNIRKSEARYLFTTHFPKLKKNKDCITGKHRGLNFELDPFNWPAPIEQYEEYDTGKRKGVKTLAVWKISDLGEC